MKKILLAFGLVLTAGFLLASESPSLDGRAVVADAGVFPKGLFAKTVGYLPGDSISVTNPSNGDHVDILVIGSLDPSEGVAIMLSPEAAESLSIKKNSNNLVKLTKRNGTADEVVNGTAVLTQDPSSVAAAPAEEATKPPVKEEPVAPAQEIAESPAEAENEEIAESPVSESEEVAALPLEEPVQDEYPEDEAEEVKNELVEGDEIPDYLDEELAEGDELPEDSEEPELAFEEEPVYDEEPRGEIKDELVEADEIPEDEEEEDFALVLEPLDELDEESEIEENEITKEEGVSDEDSESIAGDTIEDEYDAIVLIPSDANPPVSNLADEDNLAAVQPAPESEEKPEAGSVRYLNDGNGLSGDYYVQIAVYNKSENINEVSALYGSRYPLTVLDNARGKTVLVGPLSEDEYGTVLERFKSYGFKDAFVKTGRSGR